VPEAVAVISKPSESLALQWLALAMTPRLGSTRARRLVEHFGGVQNIFKASLTELEATGIQTVSAQALGTGQSMEFAHDEMGRVAVAGVSVVCLDDSSYPEQLKQIYDPPLVLYVRGNVDAITHPGIAVVGTRHPTPYGLGMAERLACDLANRGLVIFSGPARGVDAAAHRGAINAKGKTVAVFGTGVDIIYPKENTRLTEQMLSLGGALISEFPMNTFAAPQNFPFAIASSAAFQSAYSWWRPRNIAAPGLRRAVPWNRIAKYSQYPAM
jgi:DNA processing protein